MKFSMKQSEKDVADRILAWSPPFITLGIIFLAPEKFQALVAFIKALVA